jgi:hypothetical protein
MTVIFPHIYDKELEPFLEPFSRMMFGYGRAMNALREIAIMVKGDEVQAARFLLTVNSATMVGKFRDLCEPTFEPDRLDELLGYIGKLSELYRRRNVLVHGEWWFDAFDGSGLSVRDWDTRKGEPIHVEAVTPESLEQLAREFDEVSSDIDMFSYQPELG